MKTREMIAFVNEEGEYFSGFDRSGHTTFDPVNFKLFSETQLVRIAAETPILIGMKVQRFEVKAGAMSRVCIELK